MKAWWTARELAKLGLPGLPATTDGMKRRADAESWVGRERASSGGRPATEYHISSLPAPARIALARAGIDPEAPYRQREGDKTHTPCVRGQRDRGQARLYLVNLFTAFAAGAHFHGGHARAAFCALYNAPSPSPDSDLNVPEWVRDYVPRANPNTLRDWQRRLKRDGVEALAGQYGHRQGKGTIDADPALRDFCAVQIETRAQLTAAQLQRGIKAEFKLDLPRRTVQRWMQTFREENAARLLALKDPDSHKSRHQPAFGSASARAIALNQVWEIDATPADVMTVEPDGTRKRMNLTGIIDVYTRRAMVLVSETAKATAASGVLRKAILDWGVPEAIKTDNGKDFVSAHFTRALMDLGIEQTLCPPFTPEGKPHIERFFGTVSRDLLAIMPGFVGHNVADRKAIEARRSFAQRFGERDRVIEVSVSAAGLQAYIDSWISTVYERRPHEGLRGRSPFEVAARWTGGIRQLENPRYLDQMLMEAPDKDGLRTVGKKGIRVSGNGFIAAELATMVGSRVHVRLDPCDLGRIHVFDAANGVFICVAECPELTGIDRQETARAARLVYRESLAALRRENKRNKRRYRPERLHESLLEDAARTAETVIRFPHATRLHETDATRAAGDALRAQEGPGEQQLSEEDRELAEAALAGMNDDGEAPGVPAQGGEVVSLADARWGDDPPPAGDGVEWILWAQRHRDRLDPLDRKFLEEEEADPEMQALISAVQSLRQ